MVELAVLVAVMWAASRAWDTSHQAVKRHTAARRTAVPDKHKRAAARQAWLGYWIREITHGLPRFREGWGAGWHDHQQVHGDHQREAARRKAEHAERQVTWQAEIAAYLHRLEIAAAKYREGPSMSDQLRAAVAALHKRLEGDQQPDPAANGHQPPDGKHRKPDRKPDPDPDPEPDDEPEPVPVPPPDNQPEGGPMAADINYEQTLATCDEATAAAEEGVNSEALAKVTALVDGLGAMLRDDADSCGQAADAAQEAAAVKEHAGALIDAITALKTGVETKYGPQQEALDAAGVGQPEVGYLEH